MWKLISQLRCSSSRARSWGVAGLISSVTPFNGDHTAGVQLLNTSNFNNDQGPLRQIQ